MPKNRFKVHFYAQNLYLTSKLTMNENRVVYIVILNLMHFIKAFQDSQSFFSLELSVRFLFLIFAFSAFATL